jgi:hypothetical protein
VPNGGVPWALAQQAVQHVSSRFVWKRAVCEPPVSTVAQRVNVLVSIRTELAFIEDRQIAGRRLVNNPWLLPGEFVVDADGTLKHTHPDQHCEDFPDPRILITAVIGRAI